MRLQMLILVGLSLLPLACVERGGSSVTAVEDRYGVYNWVVGVGQDNQLAVVECDWIEESSSFAALLKSQHCSIKGEKTLDDIWTDLSALLHQNKFNPQVWTKDGIWAALSTDQVYRTREIQDNGDRKNMKSITRMIVGLLVGNMDWIKEADTIYVMGSDHLMEREHDKTRSQTLGAMWVLKRDIADLGREVGESESPKAEMGVWISADAIDLQYNRMIVEKGPHFGKIDLRELRRGDHIVMTRLEQKSPGFVVAFADLAIDGHLYDSALRLEAHTNTATFMGVARSFHDMSAFFLPYFNPGVNLGPRDETWNDLEDDQDDATKDWLEGQDFCQTTNDYVRVRGIISDGMTLRTPSGKTYHLALCDGRQDIYSDLPVGTERCFIGALRRSERFEDIEYLHVWDHCQ